MRRKLRVLIPSAQIGCYKNSFVVNHPPGHTVTWWRHQMETFSALLAFCAGNSPVTGEFFSQTPMKRSFDVFFDLHQNNCEAGDLRCHHARYDVTVMSGNTFYSTNLSTSQSTVSPRHKEISLRQDPNWLSPQKDKHHKTAEFHHLSQMLGPVANGLFLFRVFCKYKDRLIYVWRFPC